MTSSTWKRMRLIGTSIPLVPQMRLSGDIAVVPILRTVVLQQHFDFALDGILGPYP